MAVVISVEEQRLINGNSELISNDPVYDEFIDWLGSMGFLYVYSETSDTSLHYEVHELLFEHDSEATQAYLTWGTRLNMEMYKE
ncbi:hypothetical protein WG922_07805 [Ramlibacter sp. AN1015]|uniref:hypothetical protein n=1 Tax=Ramlibacter sp. AN1015 TaxID=3133428 RepID=UPI0030C5F6D2